MAGIQSEIVSKVLFESNPLKVCYSGQVLKGVVKLCLPSNALYRGIVFPTIKFSGCSKV